MRSRSSSKSRSRSHCLKRSVSASAAAAPAADCGPSALCASPPPARLASWPAKHHSLGSPAKHHSSACPVTSGNIRGFLLGDLASSHMNPVTSHLEKLFESLTYAAGPCVTKRRAHRGGRGRLRGRRPELQLAVHRQVVHQVTRARAHRCAAVAQDPACTQNERPIRIHTIT